MFRKLTAKTFPLALAAGICISGLSCATQSQPQASPDEPSPQASRQQQQATPSPSPVPATDQCKQFVDLCITEPPNGANVEPRPWVRGKVSTPDAKVWVIVHTAGTSDFYVQDPVTTTKDEKGAGAWNVKIYIGDAATPAGTQFEIMAIADPKDGGRDLPVGKLEKPEWPKAKWKSNVVSVTKK